MSSVTPTKIGRRYAVVRELGRGGMGQVFLVRDDEDGRLLALKLLAAPSLSETALRYFEQEFRTLTRLAHPNLVEVYEFGRDTPEATEGPGRPFFTMEYLEGRPLHRAFKAGPVELEPLFDALAQVGQALAYLHARDVIHRDLKPSNIFRLDEPAGRLKLLDFGLASRASMAAPGRLRGTAAYLAPEAMRGDRVDPRADLYALGCVIYELLTGRPPFVGASEAAVLRAHLTERPLAPRKLNPAVPEALDSLVLSLLEKDPGLRPATADEFLRRLEAVAGRPLGAEAPAARRMRVLGAGFVGRTAELERLREACRRVAGGHGGAVWILGEAGSGKSRLARELQVHAQLEGLEVFTGEPGRPARGLHTVLRRACAQRGVAAPHAPLSADRVVGLVRQLAARGPLVLLVEDTHRLAPADLECVRVLAGHLADHGEGVAALLVLTAEEEAESLQAGKGTHGDLALRLQPLGEEETAQMVRAMLAWPDVPPRLLERVMLHTRGLPLLVEELVAWLAEEGHLRAGDPESFDPRTLERVELPQRAQDLLRHRLERLSPAQSQLLEAAAVWGEERLDPDAIAALTGMRWERVYEELERLERARMLRREDEPSGAPRYDWTPPALADLIRSQIPQERSRELHGRAVAYLERRGLEPQARSWAALGAHARSAGRFGRALEAFSKAAELATGEPAEALVFLNEALEAARHLDQAPPRVLASIYESRTRLRYRLADLAGAEEDARWWLTCAEKAGLHEAAVEAHRFLAAVAARQGRRSSAIGQIEGALRHARDAGLTEKVLCLEADAAAWRARAGDAEAARALAQLRQRAEREVTPAAAAYVAFQEALLAWDRGDLQAALENATSAVADGRRTAAADALALTAQALKDLRQGSWPAAAEALERLARKTAAAAGELAALEWLLRAGRLRVALGDAEGARALLDRVRAVGKPWGLEQEAAGAALALARLAFQRGQYDDALALAAAAQRTASARGSLAQEAALLVAELRLLMGDADTAQRMLEQVGPAAGAAASRLDVERARLAGDLARTRGAVEGARQAYQEGAFLARRLGDRRTEADLLARLGETYLAENEFERARTAARRGLERIAGAGLVREEAQLRLLRARIELARPGGDRVRARVDAESALELLRRLGEPELLWQAEHLVGRAALRLGAREEGAARIRRAYRYLEAQRQRMGHRPRAAFLAVPRRRELYEDWRRLREETPHAAAAPAESGLSEEVAEYARLQRENRALRLLLEAAADLEAALEEPELFAERLMDSALQVSGASAGWLSLRLPGTAQPVELLRGEPDSTAIAAAREAFEGRPRASDEPEASQGRPDGLWLLPGEGAQAGALLLQWEGSAPEAAAPEVACVGQLVERAGALLARASRLAELEHDVQRLQRVNEDLNRTLQAQQEALAHAREELSFTRSSFEMRYRFEELVGATEPMQRVYHLIERLAPKKLPVLITGESGTGKELIARALHARSDRSGGPFFTVNCAALNPTLLESELFGHRKGAFTGADRDKPGYFELAHGGTLFLDEIGEMSEAMQAKLLRAIERGEILPVGGDREVRVDVRIVSATHRDLEALVREGRFREDLYYRIHVAHIHVPPLRERLDDIPLLVEHFLTQLAEEEGQRKREIEPEALAYLMSLSWPGNVRELQHQILRVAALAKGPTLTLRDFKRYAEPQIAAPAGPPPAPERGERVATLQEMERRQILRALEEAGGNKTRAAELLGINRATLFRKLKRLGL